MSTRAVPGERNDLARTVPMKFNLGLDVGRQGRARAGGETACLHRVEGPDLPGLVECDELILALEFAPHLQIEEAPVLAAINAGVLPHVIHGLRNSFLECRA